MTQTHLQLLMEINAKLEHSLAHLRNQLTVEEWFELVRRDMEADLLRRQNMLQEHIRHATQIIAERNPAVFAPKPEVEDDEEWCEKHQHGTYMGRCASCRDEHKQGRK